MREHQPQVVLPIWLPRAACPPVQVYLGVANFELQNANQKMNVATGGLAPFRYPLESSCWHNATN